MNLDATGSLAKVKKIGDFVQKYAMPVFLLGAAALFGFIVFRINMLANIEPTQAEKDAKIGTTGSNKIRKTDISNIEALQSQSVSLDPEYNPNRTNPFQE